MESGRNGPKGNPDASTLEATDACSAHFDGDPARFRLPKNEEGYAVYVRVTGKPGVDTSATFNPPYVDPDYSYVEDETGNDLLILLGVITGNGLAIINETGIEVFRSESNTNGKGNKVPKATEITRLFMWEGTMCYLDPFSYDDLGAPVYSCCGESFDIAQCNDAVTTGCDDCVPHGLCCADDFLGNTDDLGSDGIYESCGLFSDVGIDISVPLADSPDICPTNLSLDVTAYCRVYGDDQDEEAQWIFNIADFIGLMTDLQNNNSYNIKVRFYPLPLDIDAQPVL